MSSSSDARARFVAIRVRADDALSAECAAADAFAAGTAGLEEVGEGADTALVLYVPRPAVDAVRATLARYAVRIEAESPVPDEDWSERWKADLAPIEISPRLVVRPSFVAVAAAPDRAVVEVDPGQAFGTGAHESTRLALEWIDALAPSLAEGGVALDVGTGTGVLALALVALAPVRAVACDLDPLAGEAAAANARRNARSGRIAVFTGGVEALAPRARFAAVVANLLRRELEPLLPAIAAHARAGAPVVLSGLLGSERERVVARAAAAGLVAAGSRERTDASGETWTALLMHRAPAAASRPSGGRG